MDVEDLPFPSAETLVAVTRAIFAITIVLLTIRWIFLELLCIRNYNLCSLPGPTPGLPIFGSLLPLLRNWKCPMEQYTRWADEFGEFYKVKLGSDLVLVVSGAETFDKVFGRTGDKVNYRVRGSVLSIAMGNKGVATSDGKVWEDHRRFAVRSFRDLNLGRSSTEQLINRKFGKFVENIRKRLITEALDETSHSVAVCKGLEKQLTVPLFRLLWSFISGSEFLQTTRDEFIVKLMEGTRHQMRAAEQSGESNLKAFMSDFIVAGIESVSSSIRWTLLFLTTHPNCLQKLRNELAANDNSTMTTTDAKSQPCPYLIAVISESMRLRPAIHTIVHTTKEDLIIMENFIPKGSWILGNLWGIGHDSKHWKDSHLFKPERFLTVDGQIIKEKADKLCTFSKGPRRCLGEQLARMEIEAMVTHLVKNFEILINPEKLTEFTLEPDVTLSLIPKDDYIMLKLLNINEDKSFGV